MVPIEIERLNEKLSDHFGRDINTNQPMFRIVWADDEVEKVLAHDTEFGVQLLFPEMREQMKYSYIKHMFVLEQLVVVPESQLDVLLGRKLSYEPVWTYCDGDKNPVKPIWDATKFIIDTLHAAMGKKSLRKYVDDEKNTTKEGRDQRIKELQLELFGNETETSDALRYKEGIVVPNSYKGVQ